ncbi:hypothetical protein DPMN_017969 [Dreissena polymorpha]|uniref:Uncharacterized protein n=1 Tax=Dreissena polymorpha TaxID=45954 RepID=A0A9D4NIJ7_DREPO|nr:hypothetical protein DPMN_017969 [Dreissena polymorpha]
MNINSRKSRTFSLVTIKEILQTVTERSRHGTSGEVAQEVSSLQKNRSAAASLTRYMISCKDSDERSAEEKVFGPDRAPEDCTVGPDARPSAHP